MVDNDRNQQVRGQKVMLLYPYWRVKHVSLSNIENLSGSYLRSLADRLRLPDLNSQVMLDSHIKFN